MESEFDWRSQCEAEHLAYSGSIQPHGGLIYLDAHQHISHVSTQIEDYLPYAPASLLGQPLPEELFAELHTAIASLPQKLGSRTELFAVGIATYPSLDIVVARGNEGIVIEFFPHAEIVANTAAHSVKIHKPQNSNEAQQLHEEMAQSFREITGFNRVMIYVFREDGDGEVLAEARHAEVYGSYLGLRFPGSDIPLIARTLYLKNPWRLIPDCRAQAVPLLSKGKAAPDLTWSDLRSVSPVHLAYLANMGVQASMSFPLILSGELWGLIACHHSEPKSLSLKVMRDASLLVRIYSVALLSWQAESGMRFMDGLSRAFDGAREFLLHRSQPLATLNDIAPIVLELFDACGLAMRMGDEWKLAGKVPALSELKHLDSWFADDYTKVLYRCDSLMREHTDLNAAPACGAMAWKLRTNYGEPLHMWIFRRELLHEIEWGGNPLKPVECRDGGLDIAPRRSFEKFVEKRTGYSTPWKTQDNLKALRLRKLFEEVYG